MKALLDSSVWWKWTTGQTMRPSLVKFLSQNVTEYFLCPVSVMEMYYHLRNGRLEKPNFPDWERFVLEGYRMAPVSFEAARLAGSWNWEHGDPCDRIIAAVAAVEGIPLIHTDKRLEKLSGFPQRYFRNVLPELPGNRFA